MNAEWRGAFLDDSAALSFYNSAALSHVRSAALSNQGMRTVEEVRRLRLLELKQKHGSLAAINKALGRTSTDSTLSQIANQAAGSKTDKPKTMGSPQARAIEAALKLETGWMDTDPALLQPAGNAWPFQGIDYTRFERLTQEQKAEIQGALRQMINGFEAESLGERSTSSGTPKIKTGTDA